MIMKKNNNNKKNDFERVYDRSLASSRVENQRGERKREVRQLSSAPATSWRTQRTDEWPADGLDLLPSVFSTFSLTILYISLSLSLSFVVYVYQPSPIWRMLITYKSTFGERRALLPLYMPVEAHVFHGPFTRGFRSINCFSFCFCFSFSFWRNTNGEREEERREPYILSAKLFQNNKM